MSGAGVHPELAGFVLAGGRSVRMGQDKALLEFRGRTMIERAVGTLRAVADPVAIVGRRPDLARFAPVMVDEVEDAGPLAGMVAGLKRCPRPWAAFVPVDVPLLESKVMLELVRVAVSADALAVVAAAGSEVHPLCAVLHGSLGAALEQELRAGERKVMRALERAAGERLVIHRVQNTSQFANLNTPDELAQADAAQLMVEEPLR